MSETLAQRNMPSMREVETAREERILMGLIFACLVVLPINALSPLRMVLYGIIAVLELLYLLVSSSRKNELRVDMGLPAVSGLLFGYLALRCVAGGGAGAGRIIQTALFLLTLIAFARHRWTPRTVDKIFAVMGALMVAALLYWFVSDGVTNYYAAFYGQGNRFAVVIMTSGAIALLASRGRLKLRHWFVFVVCAVLMLFANSRSAILTVAVFLLLTAVFSLIARRGNNIATVAKVLFWIVLACVLVFSVVYPSLYGTEIGNRLELLSREHLNKNIFSGCEAVWKMVLTAVSGHVLFGLGLEMTPSMVYSTTFSSHNLYLQTVLQSGLVVLVLLVALLWLVFARLAKNLAGVRRGSSCHRNACPQLARGLAHSGQSRLRSHGLGNLGCLSWNAYDQIEKRQNNRFVAEVSCLSFGGAEVI